jgi:phosphohistidine phosphatase
MSSTPIKRLIIMRHAKSSWDDATRSDHDRQLNARGRRSAPRVAETLVERGWQPNFALSSDATRTRETWGHMAEVFTPTPEIRFERSLYLAGLDALQSAAHTVADSVGTLLVLGHNPGWEDMASRLAQSFVSLKTADCVLVQKEARSWDDALADDSGWTLVELIRARALTT